MKSLLASRLAAVPHRVIRPPLRQVSFWIVQAMVVGLAAAHLTVDLVSPTGPGALPAGLPVALLLVPVGYAALRYGLSGSVATAVWAVLLWLPDLLLPGDHGHVGNDLIELALVVAVAVFVGYHIDAERLERAQVQRAESEHRAAEARVRRFAELLLGVQEDERRRIARELHDEPLQLLIHLARSLEQLGSVPGIPATLTDGLEGARHQALEVVDHLRAVAAALRPPALEQLGLVAAVRGFLVSVGDGAATRMDLQVTGNGTRLAPEVELGAFRIAQEAVNNVVRHAGAEHLWLTLDLDDGGLRLRVADDGRGFDPAALDSGVKTEHLGLLGMRERATLLGGRLEVQSAPGKGTIIEARLSAAPRSAR